jgi:RimJ/RimL family protein N-acetyltransferase
MPVVLTRPATEADIAWIFSQERRPDFAAFIHRWPPEQHARNLADADKLYLIGENEARERIAFVILAGLRSEARNVELVRMGVACPGMGVGKPLLMSILQTVFQQLRANRLWLDVFDDNVRARRVYRAVGFREERTPAQAALKADGEPGNLIIMSILAADYHASMKRSGSRTET